MPKEQRVRYVRSAGDVATAQLRMKQELHSVRQVVHTEMAAERPQDHVIHDGMVVAFQLAEAIRQHGVTLDALFDTDTR